MAGGEDTIVELQINSLGGTLCTVQVSSENSCIRDVKLEVEKLTGILAREQRLSSDNILLPDEHGLLGFLNGAGYSKEAATVTLIRRTAEEGEWFERVSLDPASFMSAPEEIRANEEIALVAVSRYYGVLQVVSEALRSNRDLVLKAVSFDEGNFWHASHELRADREVALAACQRHGRCLEIVSEELQNDREIVLAAVSQFGLALKFAAPAFCADREIVLAAVSRDSGLALQYASLALRGDRELILAALQAEYQSDAADISGIPSVLQLLPAEFRSDPVIVLKAVLQVGLALEFASVNLRADRSIVLAAVTTSGEAIRFASDDLCVDREVVAAALAQDGTALEHLSDDLKADREIVLSAVSECGNALEYASEQLRADPDVVLRATASAGEAIAYASEALKASRDFVLKVVSRESGGYALDANALPQHWLEDREIVLAAVGSTPWFLYHVSDTRAGEALLNDKEVVLTAVRVDGSVFHFASERLRKDLEVITAALVTTGEDYILSHVPYAFRAVLQDDPIFLEAVRNLS